MNSKNIGLLASVFAVAIAIGCGKPVPADASDSGGGDVIADAYVGDAADAPVPTDGADVQRQDAGCMVAGDCNDSIDCTDDACMNGVCTHVINRTACAAGQSCDLRRGGCTSGNPCSSSTSSECVDTDPCTTHEICDVTTHTCLYQLLDDDDDGFASPACGGTDCDDRRNLGNEIHPGAAERCNGVDDNCNGVIDDGFDLMRDNNNCGECRVVCGVMYGSPTQCYNGTCTRACPDPPPDPSMDQHCPSGDICQNGFCQSLFWTQYQITCTDNAECQMSPSPERPRQTKCCSAAFHACYYHPGTSCP